MTSEDLFQHKLFYDSKAKSCLKIKMKWIFNINRQRTFTILDVNILMVVFQTDLRGNSSNQHYKSPLPVVVTLRFLVLLCQHIGKKKFDKVAQVTAIQRYQ